MNLKRKYISMLEEKIAFESNILCDGQCENIGQYNYACGKIYGLRMAIEAFEEMVASMMEEEKVEDVE